MGRHESAQEQDSSKHCVRPLQQPCRPLQLWLTLALATALSVLAAVMDSPLRLVGIGAAAAGWVLVVVLGVSRLRTARRRLDDATQHIVLDDQGLSLSRGEGKLERMVSLQNRFGLTLFVSASKDRAALAITTPDRTLCIGASSDNGGRILDDAVLQQAVTLSTEELIQAAITPDGDALIVTGASLRVLLDRLTRLDQRAMTRCFLSDTSGEQVVLDGTMLRVRRRTFDLSRPFEWRATVFREQAGQLDATFQATWVRQEQDEVVLVALLGSEARWSLDDTSQRPGKLEATMIQESLLTEGRMEPPPPKDRRVGIDRLFMRPLRSAINRASQPKRTRREDNAN